MKLCIISHTEHYKTSTGELVSWGATVTEINHLTKVFDEIYHVAMYYDELSPASSLPYTSNKIKFIPIPVLGGHTLASKLKTITNIPKVISIVNKTLKKVDCFQLRCPTGVGVFLIPYLNLCVNKPGWYKYAGNWNQEKPPLGYFIQRSLLKKQTKVVTINGKWNDQKEHCLTFENPTLVIPEIEEGEEIIKHKDYSGKLNFCFVGRLEKPKGVERIIKAIGLLKNKHRIGTIHFVGDGKEMPYFKKIASETDVNIVFHGGLPRDKVFEIYKQSHAFLLPSTASEGFPKVIAEALCYGCVPIVSDISSITQYIKHNKNGLILKPVNTEILGTQMDVFLHKSASEIKELVLNNKDLLQRFTYEFYVARIKNDVMSSFKQKL